MRCPMSDSHVAAVNVACFPNETEVSVLQPFGPCLDSARRKCLPRHLF